MGEEGVEAVLELEHVHKIETDKLAGGEEGFNMAGTQRRQLGGESKLF